MITGSLREGRGKYYSVLNLPKHVDGRRNQKRVPLDLEVKKGNKKLAQKLHREVLAEYNQEKTEPDGVECDILFCDFVELWLEEKRKSLQLNTYESYKATVDKHITPHFKELGIVLSDVKQDDLKTYYDLKKKTLKSDTVKKHHAILKPTLQKAVEDELISANPAAGVIFKKSKKQFVAKFLTHEQGAELLEKTKGTILETIVILAMYLGLRRSEIAGLKWSAIDFVRNTVEVRHTIVRYKTNLAKDGTKSESSHRFIPLIPIVKLYLLNLREQQQQEKKTLGKAYKDTDYVCRYANGVTMKPQYMSAAFKKFLAKNDLPHIRLHDLRHTCASILLESGCDMKTISDILGHSDIGITMNLYAHVYDKTKIDALNRLGDKLSPQSVTQSVTQSEKQENFA